MKATAKQIQRFHALLYYTHLRHSKEYMLGGCGAESTKELSGDQIEALIGKLADIQAQQKEDSDKAIREWRHKVLRQVARCIDDSQDWEAVNRFLLDPRIAGKHLYKLTIEELQALHRKLHNVADRKAEQAEKMKALASQN